jgi:DNA polymerase V
MRNKIYALVDCNTFYASCEKVFRPDLKNRPVVVLSNNDGCIVALSPEAKQIGIRRGVPLFQVEELIKKYQVAVFSSNYELYGDLSNRVMQTIYQFSPDIEVYSIDEAFLDLSSFKHLDLEEYAREVQQTVYQNTGLPVSVGIGATKTQAKLANKIGKKYKEHFNGVFSLLNHPQWEKIYRSFDVSNIWGVGAQYTKKLFNHNIRTIWDFVQADSSWVKKKYDCGGFVYPVGAPGQGLY